MIKHISNCKLNKMEVNFITLFPTKVVVKAAMPNSILIQKYFNQIFMTFYSFPSLLV